MAFRHCKGCSDRQRLSVRRSERRRYNSLRGAPPAAGSVVLSQAARDAEEVTCMEWLGDAGRLPNAVVKVLSQSVRPMKTRHAAIAVSRMGSFVGKIRI